LRGASVYWDKCEKIYGTGSPYRTVVADETLKLFSDEELEDYYRRLGDEVNRGWEEFIRGLDEILEAPVLETVG
jgi:hypothetical protein